MSRLKKLALAVMAAIPILGAIFMQHQNQPPKAYAVVADSLCPQFQGDSVCYGSW